MAFGADLKDFVASFQAGYSMAKSKEEKERERAEEKRKGESHIWEGRDKIHGWSEDAKKHDEFQQTFDEGVRQHNQTFEWGVNKDKHGMNDTDLKRQHDFTEDYLKNAREERRLLLAERVVELEKIAKKTLSPEDQKAADAARKHLESLEKLPDASTTTTEEVTPETPARTRGITIPSAPADTDVDPTVTGAIPEEAETAKSTVAKLSQPLGVEQPRVNANAPTPMGDRNVIPVPEEERSVDVATSPVSEQQAPRQPVDAEQARRQELVEMDNELRQYIPDLDQRLAERQGSRETPQDDESYTPSGPRRQDEPQRPQEIARSLVDDLQRDFGMPREVAVGIVGQLAHESGGFRQMQELNPMVKGSRGGFGYAQWTGPRRRMFERFADAKGLDPRSYEANYRFLRYELANTSEGRVMRGLRRARSAREAGRIFTNGFLRPGIPGYSSRDRWTDRVAGLYAKGGVATAIPEPVMNYASGGFVNDFANTLSKSLDSWTYKDAKFRDENENEDEDAPSRFEQWTGLGRGKTDGASGGVIPEDEESTQWFAEGGMPMTPEEQQAAAEDALLIQQLEQEEPLAEEEVETALPEEDAPVPQPRPYDQGEEPTSQSNESDFASDGDEADGYEWGRRAVADGMKRAAKELNDRTNTAVQDPETEQHIQDYNNGYGAADDQLMKQVYDHIDPDRKMDPSERALKGIGIVYKYHKQNGNEEKAMEAAKDMIFANKQAATRFMLMAQGAVQNGDIPTAVKATVLAYMNVPNGKNMKIDQDKNGNLDISVVDAKTGKTVRRHVVDPEQFSAQIMGMGPATFDEEIMRAAGEKPEDVKTTDMKPGGTETVESEARMDSAYGNMYSTEDRPGTTEGEAITANPDAAFMNAAKQKTLKAAAKNLMSVEGNNMSEAEALEFLDPSSPEPYGKKEMPGTNFYRVKRNGVTKIINKEQYNKVVSDWQRIQRQKGQNVRDDYAKKEFAEAEANDPKNQTDVLGAASRFLTPDKVTPIVDETTRRRKLHEDAAVQQTAIPDVGQVLETAGDVLGGGRKRPLPGREPAEVTAVPEEQTGLIDQFFTPGKPASDIAKVLTGTTAERAVKQRDQLQAVLDMMQRTPQNYGERIAKYQGLVREKNAEIAETLRSEIAALERDAAQATGESDTTNYQAEIARRRQALAEHEKRLTAAR